MGIPLGIGIPLSMGITLGPILSIGIDSQHLPPGLGPSGGLRRIEAVPLRGVRRAERERSRGAGPGAGKEACHCDNGEGHDGGHRALTLAQYDAKSAERSHYQFLSVDAAGGPSRHEFLSSGPSS
jgi:hypothetical protein